jgi:hypothetical protein
MTHVMAQFQSDHRRSLNLPAGDQAPRLLGSLVESAMTRPMAAAEHTALDQALRAVVAGTGTPKLPTVVDALLNPTLPAGGATIPELIVDGREVGHALGRLVSGDLTGLFDSGSTVTFDPSLPMISLDLSRSSGSDQLIAMVMACASRFASTPPSGESESGLGLSSSGQPSRSDRCSAHPCDCGAWSA